MIRDHLKAVCPEAVEQFDREMRLQSLLELAGGLLVAVAGIAVLVIEVM